MVRDRHRRALGLNDLTCLDSFHGDPNPLYLTAGEAHTNALKVGSEGTLGVLHHVGSDTAALLRLTLTGYSAPTDWTLTCDYANSGHGCSLGKPKRKKESPPSGNPKVYKFTSLSGDRWIVTCNLAGRNRVLVPQPK